MIRRPAYEGLVSEKKGFLAWGGPEILSLFREGICQVDIGYERRRGYRAKWGLSQGCEVLWGNHVS